MKVKIWYPTVEVAQQWRRELDDYIAAAKAEVERLQGMVKVADANVARAQERVKNGLPVGVYGFEDRDEEG